MEYERGTGSGSRLVLLAFHFSELGTCMYVLVDNNKKSGFKETLIMDMGAL